MAQAVVHGALNCGILPEDDPSYQSCKPSAVPKPYIDFNKVGDANELWYWIDHTLKPNVRVQDWYNGEKPYFLKGYLNDRVSRLIGHAIIRQVRVGLGACKPAAVIRDTVRACTGAHDMGTEDDRDYCVGWRRVPVAGVAGMDYECERIEEFE